MTRAAFLRALPGHGFVPPETDVVALGGELPVGAAADRFAADVDAFAAAFWALAPGDRRARWAALTARAAGPGAARLGEIRRALDIPAAIPADPAAAELVALARELFLLSPRARAARREAWLAERADDLPRFAVAVVTGDAGVRLDPWLSARVVNEGHPALIHRLRLVESLDQRRRRRERDRRGFVERCLDSNLMMVSVLVIGLGLGLTLIHYLQEYLRPPALPSARTPAWSQPRGTR